MSDRFDQHFRQMRPAFALRLANELPASSISVNRPVISTSMLLSGGKGHAVSHAHMPQDVFRHHLDRLSISISLRAIPLINVATK